MSIGDYLRAFRSEHDLTKTELAQQLRSKLRTVEDWEAERRSPPDFLPLALSAVSLKINPWVPTRKLTPDTPLSDIQAAAKWLFSSEGQSKAIDMEDAFERCVPSGTRPSEALLFAHLLNAGDGYNFMYAYEDWSKRSRSDNTPAMSLKPDLDGISPTIVIELKWEDEVRLLAIFIDSHRPGERSPEKLRVENALIARGMRVMSFAEAEIFFDPDECKARIENAMSDLTDDCLIKLGHIQPRRPRHAID